MTAADLPPNPAAIHDSTCCDVTPSALPSPLVRDARWRRAARWARWLSWASLAWMLTEGVVGLWQGLIVGSIALTGWALGSAVEGLASLIVIWRFTGSRTMSETAERRAQRGVAVSFWLLAPYIAAESIHHLLGERHADTVVGTWRRRLTHVPIPMAVSSRKKVDTNGYLWQTVLSVTGQTDDLLTAVSGETESTAP